MKKTILYLSLLLCPILVPFILVNFLDISIPKSIDGEPILWVSMLTAILVLILTVVELIKKQDKKINIVFFILSLLSVGICLLVLEIARNWSSG